MTCFICEKQSGQGNPSPGGYIYVDSNWRVCHAPIKAGPAGTLILESRRHFLDFSDMNEEEAASYGVILKMLFVNLKPLLNAERIYLLLLLEGASHFHIWLVPRKRDQTQHGLAFLSADYTCTEEEACQIVDKLKIAFSTSDDNLRA
jgi:diadenosine tetraphosphate (Ap4A) HIT family hydrolase